MNDYPRLHGYPIDEAVVRDIRARQRARELQRQARRQAQEPTTGVRRLLRLLSR